MTRGNFLLITDTANWMSIQFNGDMYPSCNGKFVYHMLESVETYDDLAAAILKFDEERFGYADMHDADLAPASISDDIDFSKDYFAIYNSGGLCLSWKILLNWDRKEETRGRIFVAFFFLSAKSCILFL